MPRLSRQTHKLAWHERFELWVFHDEEKPKVWRRAGRYSSKQVIDQVQAFYERNEYFTLYFEHIEDVEPYPAPVLCSACRQPVSNLTLDLGSKIGANS